MSQVDQVVLCTELNMKNNPIIWLSLAIANLTFMLTFTKNQWLALTLIAIALVKINLVHLKAVQNAKKKVANCPEAAGQNE